MKKIVLALLTIFLNVNIYSQTKNLVLNPSFEQINFNPEIRFVNNILDAEYFHKCYTINYDIYNPVFCDSFCVKHWFTKMDKNVFYYSSRNIGTFHDLKVINGKIHDSVYFNNDTVLYSVPYNSNGYIPAASGESYICFVPIMWNGIMNPITGYFSEPLKKDSVYKFSFYLRNAQKMSYFCLKKMEVKFSIEKDIFKNYSSGFFWYQYVFNKRENRFAPDLIFDIEKSCDSMGWIQYAALYKASGGERYVTIGIFFQGEDLIKLTNEYMNNYKNVKWEKNFLKKHSYNKLFFNNENYNLADVQQSYKNKFDETKRAFYLMDNVSLTPYINENK